MKGIYIGKYKIYDFNKEMVYYEFVTLNKLGISYSVVYGEENELEITIKYNINTIVNLNNYILNAVNRCDPLRLGLGYYSLSSYYSFLYPLLRSYSPIIFNLFKHILNNYKLNKK